MEDSGPPDRRKDSIVDREADIKKDSQETDEGNDPRIRDAVNREMDMTEARGWTMTPSKVSTILAKVLRAPSLTTHETRALQCGHAG